MGGSIRARGFLSVRQVAHAKRSHIVGIRVRVNETLSRGARLAFKTIRRANRATDANSAKLRHYHRLGKPPPKAVVKNFISALDVSAQSRIEEETVRKDTRHLEGTGVGVALGKVTVTGRGHGANVRTRCPVPRSRRRQQLLEAERLKLWPTCWCSTPVSLNRTMRNARLCQP